MASRVWVRAHHKGKTKKKTRKQKKEKAPIHATVWLPLAMTPSMLMSSAGRGGRRSCRAAAALLGDEGGDHWKPNKKNKKKKKRQEVALVEGEGGGWMRDGARRGGGGEGVDNARKRTRQDGKWEEGGLGDWSKVPEQFQHASPHLRGVAAEDECAQK